MDTKTLTFTSTLKEHRYSVTKVRMMIFETFLKNEPLSIMELYAVLSHLMNRTSIYRTLDVFEKIGIVKRIQIGWKHKFELSDIFLDHHHHATCMQCGDIYRFEENTTIEKQLLILAKKMRFKINEHSLELRGICSRCHDLPT